MGWWGYSYALGPFLNNPVLNDDAYALARSAANNASAAAEVAASTAAFCTEKEEALIAWWVTVQYHQRINLSLPPLHQLTKNPANLTTNPPTPPAPPNL